MAHSEPLIDSGGGSTVITGGDAKVEHPAIGMNLRPRAIGRNQQNDIGQSQALVSAQWQAGRR